MTRDSEKMRLDYLVHKESHGKPSTSRSHSARKGSGSSALGSSGAACPYCGMIYSQRGNVSKHIKTAHLDERPHSCRLCQARFHFADGLQRHIGQVHAHATASSRPFKCLECGACFKQRCHLSKHTNSAHRNGR